MKAIKPTEKRDKFNGSVIWECECECGNIAYVSASDLIREKIKSCGCLEQDSRIKNGVKVSEYVKANSCVDNTSVIAIKSNKIFKNNTSGIRGVCWSNKEQKWVAQIDFKGKHYRLGSFKKKEDAANARKTAEKELFGNFLEWYASEYPQKWEMLNKNKTEKKLLIGEHLESISFLRIQGVLLKLLVRHTLKCLSSNFSYNSVLF